MKKETTMPQIVLRWVVSLLILAGGIGVMLALGGRPPQTKPTDKTEKATLLETARVLPHTAGLDIAVDGVVTPYREIEIKSQVAGRIDQKAEACRTGRFVRQGQPLIEIDLVRYQREVRIVQAEIKELDVDLESTITLIQLAQSERQLQQKDLERLLSVEEEDVYGESEIDRARRAVLVADNAVQTLQNKLALTRARLDRAKITEERARDDLERATVKAPVDGVIVSDSVELGSYVAMGQPLFVVEDTAAVEVKCNLEMDDIYWLWYQSGRDSGKASPDTGGAYELPPVPTTVTYQLAGRADLQFTWEGKLSRYDGIGVDERTRTVPCRLVIDRPRQAKVTKSDVAGSQPDVATPPALVRGMYVRVLIHSNPSAEFVSIPERAVRPGKKVWRVRDGKLNILGPVPLVRLLVQGNEHGDVSRYWLTPKTASDIRAGDELVTTPLPGAKDGMSVRVKASHAQVASEVREEPHS